MVLVLGLRCELVFYQNNSQALSNKPERMRPTLTWRHISRQIDMSDRRGKGDVRINNYHLHWSQKHTYEYSPTDPLRSTGPYVRLSTGAVVAKGTWYRDFGGSYILFQGRRYQTY